MDWQTSDRNLQEYGLSEIIESQTAQNLPDPIQLDIFNWPELNKSYDAIYSANCIHIIPEQLLEPYVKGAASVLKNGGIMCVYGPYKYKGDFTTESNAQFNEWLKVQYPGSGIKDFEEIDRLATQYGLIFEKDIAMPANNQFIVWKKN